MKHLKIIDLYNPLYPSLMSQTDQTLLDDPAQQFIHTRPINCQPGSSENLKQARRWLEDCLHSHPKCKTEQNFMPSRILHIDKIETSGEFEVLIEQTHDLVQPFVALSYCWGGDQPYKTTKSRMESDNLCLQYGKLAKSVQDAIRVTLSLGLRYLWVDALCIIQDDEDDKIEQIIEMPRIYNQACVTIFAARSDRATKGFLDEIDLVNTTQLAVRLPFRCPDQYATVGSAYITHIEDSAEYEPIHFRAWTLQERYLSNRCLEFGSIQTRWVCASSHYKDCYCDGWKREGSDEVSTRVIYIHRELQQDIEDMTSEGSSAEWIADWIRMRWETIVNHYTPRRLSVLTDRSLAISGIAQVFGSYLQDDYLAGLWKKTLPSSLCWQVIRVEGQSFPCPIDYQGPSWSWTGINGPVNFLYARSCEQNCRAALLNTKVGLVNTRAKYGSVRRGVLTLKGRLKEAALNLTTTGNLLKIRSYGHSDIDDHGEAIMMESIGVFLDTYDPRGGKEEPIDVSLFEIGNCVTLRKRGPVGLILHAKPSNTTYSYRRFTRLGLFHLDTKSEGKIKGEKNSSANTGASKPSNQMDLFAKATEVVIEIE